MDLYDKEQPSNGAWVDQVAEKDGMICIWCNRPIARHQPITVGQDDRVAHRDCFEEQPTEVHKPENLD
jgi:hypothetical protein